MANDQHETELRKGVESWNAFRDRTNNDAVDLSGLQLERQDFNGINLLRANLAGANLRKAQLKHAHLKSADFTDAIIEGANFEHASARQCRFDNVRGQGARFLVTTLRGSSFNGADLREATFYRAYLRDVQLDHANLTGARLSKAYLERASCIGANLTNVDFRGASLVRTIFDEADLTDARVYGVATWGTSVEGACQKRLFISRTEDEPPVFVDELASAHIVSLMMDNADLRSLLTSVASRFVLILGRFSMERKPILDLTREALRNKGYAAVLFDFERPSNRAFIEVIRTLAGLSRFVVVDLTDPRVVHQELDAILTDYPSVPVRPIIAGAHKIPATLMDHAQRRALVLPVFVYDDEAHLLASLQHDVIEPAEARAQELEELLSQFMETAFTLPETKSR